MLIFKLHFNVSNERIFPMEISCTARAAADLRIQTQLPVLL